MIANENDILAAYKDAAIKEVTLSKLERQKRELDTKIFRARSELVKAKDKIQQMHFGFTEIVTPYDDADELIIRTDGGREPSYPGPPAQNRTCGFPASGSHLG
jgi:hypothetical protein